MDLSTQKRMAADVLNCGKNKVNIDPKRQEDVADAITKADIRRLVQEGAIVEEDSPEQSRGRARQKKKQEKKGRRKGQGSRKGKKGGRQREKEEWISKIRAQRKLLKNLREDDKIKGSIYRDVYNKIKGGQFNSKKQLKEYLRKNDILKEGEEIEED